LKSGFRFLKYNQLFFLGLVIFSLAMSNISFPNVLAVVPDWQGKFYTLNEGGVEGAGIPTFPVVVTVNDATVSGVGTIQVRITSSVDPVGFDLTLNEGPLGIFKNTNLALMSENGFVTTLSSLTITVFDDRNVNPLLIQTLQSPPRIMSDSDTTGITPTFTETGLDTNLFSATINFDTTSNTATNTLAVLSGDIFSVWDSVGGNLVNGFVVPNPDVGKGAILAKVGGTVTATHQGDSSSFVITPNPGTGRGSGGLIKPGLVVDSSSGESNGNGGGCTNCTPPTLGLDSNYNRIVQHGFSFNDNPVDVEYHYTPHLFVYFLVSF